MAQSRRQEDLKRELAELYAASKTGRDGVAPGSVAGPVDSAEQLDPSRRSGDRRKASTEGRKASSEAPARKNSSELPDAMQPAKSGSLDGLAPALSWSKGASYSLQQPRDVLEDDGGGKRSCCPSWLPFRAIRAALRRYPSVWITSVLVMLVLAAAGVTGVLLTAANETQQRRLAAEGFAINAALAFERQLAQMFGPLLSLSTIIRHTPDYKVVNATFDAIAKELMEQMPTKAVTTLIAAPQGVLRNFYPLEGYCQDRCSNININLFKAPDRRDVALKTVKDGKLIMQGPMTLSQGYFGVVGRQPVFIDNSTADEDFGAPDGPAFNCSPCWNATSKRRFWGFVNAVINLEPLVSGNDSRLSDLKALGYRYHMFKFEKNGSYTKLARSESLPDEPVETDVHVPGSTWHLLVSPESGWVPVWRAPILAVVVLFSVLIGLLIGAILVSSKLQGWLKAANDALASEKARTDVLLARQYNLISCVLEGEPERGRGKAGLQNRTLARIEDMRREIGVAAHTSGAGGGVDELQLAELLDEGTFGKVFRGMWRGTTVAVKTMVLPAKMSGAEKRERMAIMEAAISSALCHPNIVQTYTYIIKPCATSHACANSSDGGSSPLVTESGSLPGGASGMLDAPEPTVHNFEVSLVIEFCDWGSLRTALDAGAFFAEDNSLNYPAILDTAADVARAMFHLHKNQVLHSDLKVRNVLLKSDACGRGCVAKVADFGLAVRMDCMDTHVSAFQGTLSHMPPESLLHGRVSKAGDVYAYGITLWELFTGGQAYQGIPRALVGHKVAVMGLRPTLPPFTPTDFRSLVEDCWHQDPDKRPSFEAILERLSAMRSALAVPATPPLQRYKLRPKATSEERERARPLELQGDGGADGGGSQDVAAVAAANGLLHMASYYVNNSMTGSSTSPYALGGGGGGYDAPPLAPAPGAACDAGGSFGSGCSNGNGHGGPPRVHFTSRLYSMSGGSGALETIADTEDADSLPRQDSGGAAAAAAVAAAPPLSPAASGAPAAPAPPPPQQPPPLADIETGAARPGGSS